MWCKYYAMKGKRLIYGLYQLLKYILYLNMVLAGGVMGFQTLNLLRNEKTLITSYLGKFSLDLNAAGILHTVQNTNVAVYFEQLVGAPSLGVNTNLHGLFVMLFTVGVVGVTLFYNYKFYYLFKVLYASVKSGTPFTFKVSTLLKQIALFSVGVFLMGSVLSLLKLWMIDDIVFENFVARPVFDNQFLNYLWFGLGIYILNEIYKVGLSLKKEQELTI